MNPTSTLDRLASLDTNTVSDALDFLGLPGATYGLRPLWDCPKIVGRASTIQLGPKTDAKPTVHLISPVIDAVTANDRVLVANKPADAAVIEADLTTGKGLLVDDGVSISNLFTGDAPSAVLTMSRRARGAEAARRAVAEFVMSPSGLTRGISRSVSELARDRFQARRGVRFAAAVRAQAAQAFHRHVRLDGVEPLRCRIERAVVLAVQQLVAHARHVAQPASKAGGITLVAQRPDLVGTVIPLQQGG